MLTVAAVGLSSKLFLRTGCSEVNVNGLPILLEALKEENRQGRGIITVANHISVLDDPVTWGILPWRSYFSSRTTRWTLGASDIMFTNPIFSQFFRNGQVIQTFRGKGIHQEAVTNAIQKLDQGDWIHIFPEGKVNQRKRHPGRGLLRFKWGVAHMMMQAEVPPLVIPMYLEGFDDVMPENRSFPKFVPRPGSKIRITFGDPSGITHEVESVITKWKSSSPPSPSPNEEDVRISLTNILQQAVARLGDEVTQ